MCVCVCEERECIGDEFIPFTEKGREKERERENVCMYVCVHLVYRKYKL